MSLIDIKGMKVEDTKTVNQTVSLEAWTAVE